MLTNVFRRGGVFYFRARVPAPLRGNVGRRELWRSLRTNDAAEARRRGGLLLSLTEALWRDLQRAMGADEIQSLIDGWLKAKLEEDADVRLTSPPEAIPAHESALREQFSGALWNSLNNDSTLAAQHVHDLLTSRGLTLEARDTEVATRLMMRAHLDFFRAFMARSEKRWRPWLDLDPAEPLLGQLKAQPPSVTRSPSSGCEIYGRLSEVAREAISDFARKERWKPKRIGDYENAVTTLTMALGRDPDLGEVTAEIAGEFMRDLTRYPSNASKRKPYKELTSFRERVEAVKASDDSRVLDAVTINGKYLTPLRRIYEWRSAVKRDLLNPFQGLRAEKPRRADPQRRRRDFTSDEIKRLFALPLFTGAKAARGPSLYLPGNLKVDDWRVWVPLICFFSGMRLNEACGLAVEDIRQADGISYFHVRDLTEGQSLKSAAARRKVPIHSELVQVGFLAFWERQRKASKTRLFEDLPADATGYFSGKATKFFADLIDRIEAEQTDEPGQLVFHSVRHTVVTRLRAAMVPEDVRREIVGHEQGEVHGSYGGFPLELLKQSVDRIDYPGLDLSRVARP